MLSLQQDTVGAEQPGLSLARPPILGDNLTEQTRLSIIVCMYKEGIRTIFFDCITHFIHTPINRYQ